MANISGNFDVAKCRVVITPLRLRFCEMSSHVWNEMRATFPFKRFVEPNVLNDRNFDMLGECVRRDRGWRSMTTRRNNVR